MLTIKEVGVQFPVFLRCAFSDKKSQPFVQGGLVQTMNIFYKEKSTSPNSSFEYQKTSFWELNKLYTRLATGIYLPLKNEKMLSLSIFGSQSLKVFQKSPSILNDESLSFQQLGIEVGFRF
jgi:hypothetical protein